MFFSKSINQSQNNNLQDDQWFTMYA